ncbi:MAG TPA: hypothetical protein VGE72_20430 [Azospirillum sp.]
MTAIPDTTDRVAEHTARSVNADIRREADESLRHFARHQEDIEDRLADLDREWDVERALEANAASIALVGLGLAATVDRRFLALPMVVAGFLLQHAVQGWCPPLPVLRRLGFRTEAEINEERVALKALRGDFDGLPSEPAARARRALDAARV